MSDKIPEFDRLVGPAESQRVMQSLARGASRRDVLAMFLAGGMQASLAGGLATMAANAHAQTPRRGGRIRVAGATAAATDTLDPAKQSNQTDYSRGNMLYNGLFSLDGSLTPQPALAESHSTADAKTWVFKLRKGVVFHDGKALAPEDVVFSLMRHKDPATASKAKVLADQIESVKVSRPRRGHGGAVAAQRRPARDPGHLPLPHRQGRHHGFQCRHRYRPLQAQGIQARRALPGGAQRRLLENPASPTWTRSSSSASATRPRA